MGWEGGRQSTKHHWIGVEEGKMSRMPNFQCCFVDSRPSRVEEKRKEEGREGGKGRNGKILCTLLWLLPKCLLQLKKSGGKGSGCQ
jgi:hypothetical protein